MILGVLDSVTPRIRHDEPLLRILAEREVGQILSLRHPCPDRAISSFVRMWCFEECGSFIICYGGRMRNGNKRAKWTLKEDADFRFQREGEESVRKSLLLTCLLIGRAKRLELNAFRVSKRI